MRIVNKSPQYKYNFTSLKNMLSTLLNSHACLFIIIAYQYYLQNNYPRTADPYENKRSVLYKLCIWTSGSHENMMA